MHKRPHRIPAVQKLWNLLRVFIAGAGSGIVLGAYWGFLACGGWELGRFSNHALGGLFVGGLGIMGLCAIRNWIRRNPIAESTRHAVDADERRWIEEELVMALAERETIWAELEGRISAEPPF